MRDSVNDVSVPVGSQFSRMLPSGVKNTMKRLGGALAAAWPRRMPKGRIASRNGRPMATPPAPRSTARRLSRKAWRFHCARFIKDLPRAA